MTVRGSEPREQAGAVIRGCAWGACARRAWRGEDDGWRSAWVAPGTAPAAQRPRSPVVSRQRERGSGKQVETQVYFLCGYVSKRHVESWGNLRHKPLALVPKVGGCSSSPKPGSGQRPGSLITVGRHSSRWACVAVQVATSSRWPCVAVQVVQRGALSSSSPLGPCSQRPCDPP